MQTDFLQFIYQAINNMLTQNLGFFDAMGQNLFRMFATILVAWFGIKMALSAASGHSALHFEKLASLILTISFGFGMVNYYNQPIPGVGSSFHSLNTNESQFLSSKIDQNQLQTVIDGVSNFETRLDSPMWGDFLGTLAYVLIIILLAAAQAVTIVVVAWLFWGWFKAFIQYAFYQVIAAAVVYIIANLLVGVLRLPPPGTLSTVQLLAWFPVLLITFLAAIYALLKVPVLTNHIFSGASGGSSGALLGFLAARLRA
jgi:hypothetical protein